MNGRDSLPAAEAIIWYEHGLSGTDLDVATKVRCILGANDHAMDEFEEHERS